MAEGKALPVVVLVLGIIVVAVLVMGFHLVSYGNNATPAPANTGGTSTPTTQQSTSTVPSWSVGTSALTVDVTDRDALASSTLTEGTNIQTDYWWSTTGQIPLNFLQAASTSTPFGATFNMLPSYNGIFYIRTQAVSGQNYYIAPIATMQANSCIRAYDFIDVQNTGTQQWVFQCNMAYSGVAPSAANAAGSGGTSPLLPYTAMAYAYTAPSLSDNNGGSIKSVGTGANTLSTILYVEKTTTAKAFAVQEIDVKVNNTNATTLINSGLSNIQLPVQTTNGAITYQTMYFSSANINGLSDGTNVWWKWYLQAPVDTVFGQNSAQMGESLKGAYFYFAANNGSPQQINFNTNVYTSLSSTIGSEHNISVTEQHIIETPAQGTTTLTDSRSICVSTGCT